MNQILEEIGLSKAEIKVYLALLKLGESTTTRISRESKVPLGKVYENLDKLLAKGFVTAVLKRNKRHFTASDPRYLHEFLRDRQRSIEEQQRRVSEAIPALLALQNITAMTIRYRVFEGLAGIKAFSEENLANLRKGQTAYVLGAPRVGNEKLEGYLLDWHERRIKKGVRCKYLYDEDAREYGKIRAAMKHTAIRYLPEGITSPSWIEIAGPVVGIGLIKEGNTVMISINEEIIAKSFIDWFEMLWKLSKA